MVGPVYLTESGKAALEAELHDLIHSQRPAVIARIKARLSELHGIGHATVEIETGACAGAACA